MASDITTRLKGKLARRQPEVLVNISQIRAVSQFNYLSDPPSYSYTLIEFVSDSVIYTREPYSELKERIALNRSIDGPNALIEIITVKIA